MFVGDRIDKDVSKIEEIHKADDKDIAETSRKLSQKILKIIMNWQKYKAYKRVGRYKSAIWI